MTTTSSYNQLMNILTHVFVLSPLTIKHYYKSKTSLKNGVLYIEIYMVWNTFKGVWWPLTLVSIILTFYPLSLIFIRNVSLSSLYPITYLYSQISLKCLFIIINKLFLVFLGFIVLKLLPVVMVTTSIYYDDITCTESIWVWTPSDIGIDLRIIFKSHYN